MFEILKNMLIVKGGKIALTFRCGCRRCVAALRRLATVSNPAAASRFTALYTAHISVTRSSAITEGLRDLANCHASVQSTRSPGEIDGMKLEGNM